NHRPSHKRVQAIGHADRFNQKPTTRCELAKKRPAYNWPVTVQSLCSLNSSRVVHHAFRSFQFTSAFRSAASSATQHVLDAATARSTPASGFLPVLMQSRKSM